MSGGCSPALGAFVLVLVVGVSIADCSGADGAVRRTIEIAAAMAVLVAGSTFRRLGAVDGRAIGQVLGEVQRPPDVHGILVVLPGAVFTALGLRRAVAHRHHFLPEKC